jgi:RecA/RadA recombinase
MTNGRTRGHDRVPIRKLPTGVPGLDEILRGGLPEHLVRRYLNTAVQMLP